MYTNKHASAQTLLLLFTQAFLVKHAFILPFAKVQVNKSVGFVHANTWNFLFLFSFVLPFQYVIVTKVQHGVDSSECTQDNVLVTNNLILDSSG